MCLRDVLLEWRILEKVSSNRPVSSWLEIESWFSSGGSVLGKVLSVCSFRELTCLNVSYLQELGMCTLFSKIHECFGYVREPSIQANFQIAVERAESLGKEVTAQLITDDQLGTTRDAVEIAIGYREAFFELEKMDSEFRLINLNKEEWDQLFALNNAFDALHHGFDVYSHGGQPSDMCFVSLCELYAVTLALSKFHLLCGGVEKFHLLNPHIGKLHPFHNMDKLNEFTAMVVAHWSRNNKVLAAAAVLDPRFNVHIVEHWYRKIYVSEWEIQFRAFKEYLTEVYDEYAKVDSMLDTSGRPCTSSDGNVEGVSELDLYLEQVKFPSMEGFGGVLVAICISPHLEEWLAISYL